MLRPNYDELYDIEQVGYGHSFASHSEQLLLQHIATKRVKVLLFILLDFEPSTQYFEQGKVAAVCHFDASAACGFTVRVVHTFAFKCTRLF